MQKVVTLRGIESKKLQYLGCMSCMHVYTTLIYYNSLESAICNKINNDYSQLVVRTQKVKGILLLQPVFTSRHVIVAFGVSALGLSTSRDVPVAL